MWTRKAALMLTSGISLILVGMMISNFQLMIAGLTFISFLAINGWVSGHSDLEITRTINGTETTMANVYKGDDVIVELTISNNSYRRTQQLEVFDNVPHEMKMRQGINQMRMNLGPGQSTRIKYRVRCPLRGHYTLGPVSVRYRNAFNLFANESKVQDRTDITVFPQVREIEEALLRSDVPKMYTGATTLKTPGPGMEFYSLREYLPGDAFRSINWKAFARTGELMVNEKTRDAVTDVFIILDTRDVSRIGTVLKNPLEMGTIAAASVSNYFIRRRDSVALVTYGDRMDYLPPETGDKQGYKVLSNLAAVRAKGSMPLQAVTNAMSSRMSRGSPVFIISSLEGDGTTLPAIRNLAGRGHEVIVLSPSSIDLERLISRIPRMSYEVLKLERQNRLTAISGYGAKVIDWMPDVELSQALLQVRTV
ncbi:MAG: DUF58 domain-containing protein [Candidatus Thermoplasmatota archaeon]|uniref:Hypothetical conserved protein (Some members containing a von Willebrand factor type A (VWA) domain) n=1 Tax=uncultured marine group II/III euryarchaeote AD1000_15_C08 TaxID=1457729 RepID=A0A075FK42_9EURY|nr:hypothetical conserved protein (some members containing a von Willebrand factor type A (vWA) domain) [uncultured marine group II/III euryarchaeote AD1000_15_C08]MEC7714047.1 DUF58 domain-containing protein [Candidatus Thermoplasmatota archaeon]MEE3231715.1 DUF58 domain-containing protein [Candidatus Thermoplasmatota archaeon]MEE3277313.1 DUF58 domain-containing protein [Candidatus Thermoplasmatota archaeon]MEE3318577.1 DUF58 domain-containing protein [Candidatus Thermoplasmatota archaeon]|tara:strand:- start:1902 stop:3170 length:1269 start_codon:yes stop_codon:yes gene_type:complete